MQNKLVSTPNKQRKDLFGIQGSVKLSPPLITTYTETLGSLRIEGAAYTKPGSGKPEQANEDYVKTETITTRNGKQYFVAMALDGLTGIIQGQRKEEMLRKNNNNSGGRIAASFIAQQLSNQLKQQAELNEETITDATLSANLALDQLNREQGITDIAGRFATMLSLAVISESGEAYIVQIGDSQIYIPEDSLSWTGNQDSVGELSEWAQNHSPVEDKWPFHARVRGLINNPDEDHVHQEMKIILQDYGYSGRVPKGTSLVFSCLNGDERVKDFINIKRVDMTGGKTIVLCSDGIVDGIGNPARFREAVTTLSPFDAADQISRDIIASIQQNRNIGVKRWGDDEALLIIRVE